MEPSEELWAPRFLTLDAERYLAALGPLFLGANFGLALSMDQLWLDQKSSKLLCKIKLSVTSEVGLLHHTQVPAAVGDCGSFQGSKRLLFWGYSSLYSFSSQGAYTPGSYWVLPWTFAHMWILCSIVYYIRNSKQEKLLISLGRVMSLLPIDINVLLRGK